MKLDEGPSYVVDVLPYEWDTTSYLSPRAIPWILKLLAKPCHIFANYTPVFLEEVRV